MGTPRDHRPDLRQIILTLLGTREGIPVVGTVQEGNRSDKTLNAEMVAALDDYFSPTQLRQLVYVADSALVTGPNLELLAERQLRFLSRLPDTYHVAADVKAAAWGRRCVEAAGPHRRPGGRRDLSGVGTAWPD